ncbi:MAG: aminotransferase class V-fold PLP-dependent enzyme [Armatimonadetes bacterium]|nr:aminotransferase class V-fold PLP-dependent enzyme [Armatimonadota bacterium]
MPDSIPWDDYRRDWPHTAEGIVWLQHAGITPLCRRVMNVGREAMEWFATRPSQAYPVLWSRAHEGCREALAAFLGTTADRLAIVKNTSQGIIFVAESVPWRPHDNIVTLAGEYPANRLPWRSAARFGASVRVVEPDAAGRFPLDRIAAATDHDTRVVAVSWVQYLNGYRLDLAGLREICERHGAYLVADVVQGVGAVPLDLRLCDAAACGGHKWICGTEGAGFLYLSERLQAELVPFNVSWHSVAEDLSVPGKEIATEDGVPALKPGAERFEEGTPNLWGNLMLAEAARMLGEIGVANIQQRHRELQDHLVAKLVPRGYRVTSSLAPDERAGILCFRHPEHDPSALVRRLREAGIVCIRRGDSVRVAGHFYNNAEDMDRVAEALP